MDIMASLKDLESCLSNRSFSIDGRQVRFRLLKKEDTGLWTDFVNGCSRESLWLRFLVPFSATPERAQRFCDIDPGKELAIVAEMSEDERSRAIGIARLAKLSGTDKAEFAVIVSDPWQKKKLGYTLSDMSVGLVRQWGAKSVFSETLMENYAMIRVLKRCRYKVEERNGNMFTMSLDLA
jgi:acetyltransferase